MKRDKYIKVHCDVLLIRLLFINILLNLIQQRELVRSLSSCDSFKKSFAEYYMNIFKSLVKLHRFILPFDFELGSIELKVGSLKPECRQDVTPGESVR